MWRLADGGDFDVDAAAFLIEVNFAFDEREDRVIASQTDVPTGAPLRTALANNDVAGDDSFATEFLDAQPLCA
jgi:hypothetical protein